MKNYFPKLLFLLFFVALSFCFGAKSVRADAPTYVKTVCQNVRYGGGGTSIACSGALKNANDLVIVHISSTGSSNVSSVSNGSSGFTSAGVNCYEAAGDWQHIEQWYGYSGSGSKTYTVNWGSATGFVTLMVVEYSGAASSGVLDSGNACSSGYSSGTLNFGGITTTGSNERIVCGAVGAASAVVSAGSGYGNLTTYTLRSDSPTLDGEDMAAAAAGSYPTTISFTPLSTWAGGCAAYNGPLPDYTIAPASLTGYVTVPSGNFTITKASGNWGSDPHTITISDNASTHGTVTLGTCTGTIGGGSSGTAPAAISLTGGTTCTFTYTPAVLGSITLTSSIDSGVSAGPNSYTSNAATFAISGCTTGTLRTAASCTATLTGLTFDGTHTVTLSSSRSQDSFTSGSTGNPLTITPTNGSQFTFTITPYLVGKSLITLTTNTNNWVGTTSTITTSSADASTFTAKASGNWNSSSTWNCTVGSCTSPHLTPDSGDTVKITGHTVTIPAGFTAYLGTCPVDNATYDLQLQDTGSAGGDGILEIAGKLWLCGNTSLTASLHSGTSEAPVSWPELKLDTGAELDLDENQGTVAYRMVSTYDYGWGKLYAGSLTDTCTAATATCPTNIKAVNVASTNPVLFDATKASSMIYRIYGTGISDCGSASKGCLEYNGAYKATFPNYPDAGTMDIRNSIFQRTGTLQAPSSGFAYALALNLIGTRFLNDLAGMSALDYPINDVPTTCTISGNYFSDIFPGGTNSTESFGGCAFTGNVFAGGFSAYDYSGMQLSAFSDDLVVLPPGANYPQIAHGPVRNIWVNNGTTTGYVDYHMWAISQDTSPGLVSGNICYLASGVVPSESYCISTYSATPWRWIDNLSIPGLGTGITGGNWVAVGPAHASALTISVDHNGQYGTPSSGNWMSYIGHSGSGNYPDAGYQIYQSLRSNVFWAAAPGAFYAIGNASRASDDLKNDPATAFNTANIGWNAMYNQGTSTLYTTGFNSNCSPSAFYNTPYNVCATGTAGGHDILSTDPKTIDNTRTPFTWASRKHGQEATLAGMLTALQQCPDIGWCVEEARTWIRTGFQPTNLALKGKADDGKIVGFTGTYGSGYTGTCSISLTPGTTDLGTGFAGTCSFDGSGKVTNIQITNPGANYLISPPATVTIGGTCTGGCVAASLTPIISPSDIGPVQMTAIGSAD